MKFNHLILVI